MASEAPEDLNWVTIASMVGSRGNRGEVQAVPFSDKLERFQRLREVCLFDVEGSNAEPQRMEIESVWVYRGRVIFKFRGIDTISDAERLRGKEVRIPRAGRLPLERGEFYQSDLVGCEVIERASGSPLGRVKGWQEAGGPALLVVEGMAGEEILIPFASSICVEIDVEARQIRVELPDGLKDLNG